MLNKQRFWLIIIVLILATSFYFFFSGNGLCERFVTKCGLNSYEINDNSIDRYTVAGKMLASFNLLGSKYLILRDNNERYYIVKYVPVIEGKYLATSVAEPNTLNGLNKEIEQLNKSELDIKLKSIKSKDLLFFVDVIKGESVNAVDREFMSNTNSVNNCLKNRLLFKYVCAVSAFEMVY